jgi:dihydroneopterin aldolase
VFEQERQTGNRFRVDVEIKADVAAALSSDAIADSIDYTEIAEIIDTVNRSRHYHLIESLAAAIVDEILRRLPRVWSISLHLAKLSPPGLPSGTTAFVRLTRSRE